MNHYIVLRRCPPSLADFEGRWLNFDPPPCAFLLPNLECPRESIKFYPTGRTEGRLIDSEEAEIYEPRQEETPLEKASKNLSKAIVELGVAIADVFQPFIEELAKYKEEESEEEPKGG